jgi:hypothetical protein
MDSQQEKKEKESNDQLTIINNNQLDVKQSNERRVANHENVE